LGRERRANLKVAFRKENDARSAVDIVAASGSQGFPRSLPSPAPATSHRRGQTLQGRGGVSSCARRCHHLQIWPEVRGPPHAPHPPPPRCPHSRGNGLQHPTDVAHRRNDAAPPKAAAQIP
jgi:hypothetical protein